MIISGKQVLFTSGMFRTGISLSILQLSVFSCLCLHLSGMCFFASNSIGADLHKNQWSWWGETSYILSVYCFQWSISQIGLRHHITFVCFLNFSHIKSLSKMHFCIISPGTRQEGVSWWDPPLPLTHDWRLTSSVAHIHSLSAQTPECRTPENYIRETERDNLSQSNVCQQNAFRGRLWWQSTSTERFKHT